MNQKTQIQIHPPENTPSENKQLVFLRKTSNHIKENPLPVMAAVATTVGQVILSRVPIPWSSMVAYMVTDGALKVTRKTIKKVQKITEKQMRARSVLQRRKKWRKR